MPEMPDGSFVIDDSEKEFVPGDVLLAQRAAISKAGSRRSRTIPAAFDALEAKYKPKREVVGRQLGDLFRRAVADSTGPADLKRRLEAMRKGKSLDLLSDALAVSALDASMTALKLHRDMRVTTPVKKENGGG